MQVRLVVLLSVLLAASACSDDDGGGDEAIRPTLGVEVFWPGDEIGARFATPNAAVRAFFVDAFGEEPERLVETPEGRTMSACCQATFRAELSGLTIDVSLNSDSRREDDWYTSNVGQTGLIGVTTRDRAGGDGVHARPPDGTTTVEFVYRDDDGMHRVSATAAEAERGVPADAESITSVLAYFRADDGTLVAVDGGSFAD